MTCGECKHQKECLEEFAEERGCLNGFELRKMTNFDNVTASPEALAKFIDEKIRYTLDLDECPFVALCEENVECEECITRWLKQEAEEGEE